MNKICKFIGWATEGKCLVYKEIDLMEKLKDSSLLKSQDKFWGIYPSNIPKQEYVGEKFILEPRILNRLNIKFAFIEFTMNFYLFYEIE